MERGTKPYEDGQHSDVQACEGKQGRGHGVNPPRRELDTAGKMCCMYAQDSALKEVAFGVFSFSVFFFFLSFSLSPSLFHPFLDHCTFFFNISDMESAGLCSC